MRGLWVRGGPGVVRRAGGHQEVGQVVDEPYVARDLTLDDKGRGLVRAGHKRGGNAALMRKAAMCGVLARMGGYVPAERAVIGAVDRVFTRIGAADDLAGGRSTFMVEMLEAANILNNATPHSLVLLDEIGRGTSTYDGISLAWSVVEHVHDKIKCRTFFATHYHELTDLSQSLERVRNLNVAVREWEDEVRFLHKIVDGAADKSYGIHVARLAGIPAEIIERAKSILANLEAAVSA